MEYRNDKNKRRDNPGEQKSKHREPMDFIKHFDSKEQVVFNTASTVYEEPTFSERQYKQQPNMLRNSKELQSHRLNPYNLNGNSMKISNKQTSLKLTTKHLSVENRDRDEMINYD